MPDRLNRLFPSLLTLAALLLAVTAVNATEVIYQASKSKIITFDPSTTKAERLETVKKAGCKVVRDLHLVNALEIVPSGFHMSFTMSLINEAKVKSIQMNTYRKWIEASPESLRSMPMPSVRDTLKNARTDFSGVPGLGDAVAYEGEEEAGDGEETDEKVLWGIKRVKAPSIWQTTTGKGVKVAIIDTGIDYTHPDIAPNYVGGYNAVDPEADPMDDHGHGTHVAGTIGAAAAEMVVGVAPRASLYGVKVLDANGGGSYATIIAGIQWAVENRMDVVNMSLGGPSIEALEEAVKKAAEAGVVIVAAAGNDPNASVSAPARYPETIAVSASTFEDELAFFSTTGPEIDFIAPGHEIDSCWIGGQVARLSGTSMASPHVAGLAALAVSMGAKGVDEVRTKLRQAAVELPELSATDQGYGMIEADRWVPKLVAYK
ncbi:S8 family peptidase [Elusimicrobiota bacterium]